MDRRNKVARKYMRGSGKGQDVVKAGRGSISKMASSRPLPPLPQMRTLEVPYFFLCRQSHPLPLGLSPQPPLLLRPCRPHPSAPHLWEQLWEQAWMNGWMQGLAA